MEEEQGEDSEVLDAMDGWDSEEENQSSGGAANNNSGASPAADTAVARSQPLRLNERAANEELRLLWIAPALDLTR